MKKKPKSNLKHQQSEMFGDAPGSRKVAVNEPQKKKAKDKMIYNLEECGLNAVWRDFGSYIREGRNNKTST